MVGDVRKYHRRIFHISDVDALWLSSHLTDREISSSLQAHLGRSQVEQSKLDPTVKGRMSASSSVSMAIDCVMVTTRGSSSMMTLRRGRREERFARSFRAGERKFHLSDRRESRQR